MMLNWAGISVSEDHQERDALKCGYAKKKRAKVVLRFSLITSHFHFGSSFGSC